MGVARRETHKCKEAQGTMGRADLVFKRQVAATEAGSNLSQLLTGIKET